MMELPDGRKSFKIGLAVLIQYRRLADIHPARHQASQTRCRGKYRAYVYVVRVKLHAIQSIQAPNAHTHFLVFLCLFVMNYCNPRRNTIFEMSVTLPHIVIERQYGLS